MKGQNLSHLIQLLEEQEEKERHLAPEERFRLKKQREEEARQEYILRMTPVADAAADSLVAQVQQEKKERRRARQKQKQRQLKARQENAKQRQQQENEEEEEEEEGEKEKEEEIKEDEKAKEEDETKRRKEAEEQQERELVETDYVGEWQTKQTHKKKKKHGNRNQRDRRKRNQQQMSATMERREEQEEEKKKTSPPVSPFQVTFLNNLRQNELEEKLVLLSKAPQQPPQQTEEDGSTTAATTKAKWEPILSDYLSQTDYLNRTLLQSFLNNMDSLQCKWADEEEEEEHEGEDALQQHSQQDECEFSDGSFCTSSEDEKEKGAGEGERQGEEEWNPLYERNLVGKKTKTRRKKVESKHETTTAKPQFEALLERIQQKRRQKWEGERSRETSQTKDTSKSEPEEDWLNDTERLLVTLYQHMNSQFEQLFRRLDG